MSLEPITIRRMRFEFPAELDPVFIEGEPEESYVNVSMSLLLPYLEPYLIRTMTAAKAKVTDPVLREQLEGFIGQEGQHYREHAKFNEALRAKGFTSVAPLEGVSLVPVSPTPLAETDLPIAEERRGSRSRSTTDSRLAASSLVGSASTLEPGESGLGLGSSASISAAASTSVSSLWVIGRSRRLAFVSALSRTLRARADRRERAVEWAAVSVDDGVELGRNASSRASQSVAFEPPFRPTHLGEREQQNRRGLSGSRRPLPATLGTSWPSALASTRS
jgi:hypothetical protein